MMAFDVENVDVEWQGRNGGTYSLEDVVVRAEEMKSRGLSVNSVE